MFSGIVQEIGAVKNIQSKNGILELIVSSNNLISNLQVGDSIAIDGCCQTVIDVSQSSFKVQATEETIKKTNFKELKISSKVNLEPSLKIGDKLSGHLVLGHIDSSGKVSDILSLDENKIIKISFPKELGSFIAPKGSISVNGVSLTVIETKNDYFTFTLIPYTKDNTNLGLLKINDPVNLEIDVVSRYLVNYLENNKQLVRG